MAANRRALIVATGSHDDADLRRLRSPAQDAPALARALTDPAIGDYAVTQVLDQPHYVVTAAMEDFFADSRLDDLLVVHLSCHGVKDDDGRLFFAATDTKRRRLASTAVSAAYLNDLMARCRARSIVLLLDCCYSGAFVTGAKGDDGVHLKEKLSGHGRAVLTASNAIEYAWEGDDLSGQAEASLFTAAIVDGLETGEADRDGDGAVSIDDLYKHVYERVREAERPQTPLLWSLGVAGTVEIARNPHPPATAPVAPRVAGPRAGRAPGDADTGAPPPAAGGESGRGWRERLGRRPWAVVVAAVALAAVLAAALVALAPWDGDDGDVTTSGTASGGGAGWSEPAGVAVDAAGALYISETGADRVSVLADGSGSAVAGGGDDEPAAADGRPAVDATLDAPLGIAVSAAGDLFIADQFHQTVRQVRGGTITTFAGGGPAVPPGDGGPAIAAPLGHPTGVAVHPDGSVYISDQGDHRVRRVGPDGVITTVAGTGEVGAGGDDGPAAQATLNAPGGVAVGPDGAVYVADTGNHRIRRIAAGVDGVSTITTVAGTGDERFTADGVPATESALALPSGVAVDGEGRIYIADTGNDRVRMVDTGGLISTVAGNGTAGPGGDGGAAVDANLDGPWGVTVDSDGRVYIADTGNDRVRIVDTDGTISTAGSAGPA
jgi:sugar lactone lactonase YvrE